MSEKKLYMKYLVLKMNDRLDIGKLVRETTEIQPKIRDIAEIIINCLIEEKEA